MVLYGTISLHHIHKHTVNKATFIMTKPRSQLPDTCYHFVASNSCLLIFQERGTVLLHFINFGDSCEFVNCLPPPSWQSCLWPVRFLEGKERRLQNPGAAHLWVPYWQALGSSVGDCEGLKRHTTPQHQLNHSSDICQIAQNTSMLILW